MHPNWSTQIDKLLSGVSEQTQRCCLCARRRRGGIFCPRPITLLFPTRRRLQPDVVGDFIPRFDSAAGGSLAERYRPATTAELPQHVITVLINTVSCITPEPVKHIGRYLPPVGSPAGSLYFAPDHQTGKKNDQCAFVIPPRSESYTDGRGYYLS